MGEFKKAELGVDEDRNLKVTVDGGNHSFILNNIIAVAYGAGPPSSGDNERRILEDGTDQGIESGTFSITDGTNTTPPIDYEVTTLNEIVAMLEEFPSIGEGNVIEISGGGAYAFIDNGAMTIEFVNSLSGQLGPELTVTNLDLLTDGNPVVESEFAWEQDEPPAAANPDEVLLYIDISTAELYVRVGINWTPSGIKQGGSLTEDLNLGTSSLVGLTGFLSLDGPQLGGHNVANGSAGGVTVNAGDNVDNGKEGARIEVGGATNGAHGRLRIKSLASYGTPGQVLTIDAGGYAVWANPT